MIWKVLVLGVALAAGGLLWWWVNRLWRRRVLRRRRNQGRRGEIEAVEVLTDAGYQPLEEQTSHRLALVVDGEPRGYTLRPDYFVRRGDRRYVAEVKTGKKAPNPLYTPTRRQLLEYEVSFPDHGLLLVGMETRRVHEVTWPQVEPGAGAGAGRYRRLRRMIPWLAGAFVLGLVLGILVR